MKAIEIFEALAFTLGEKSCGTLVMDEDIVNEDDVVAVLEREFKEGVVLEDCLLDEFEAGASYFYSTTPLTDKDHFGEFPGCCPVDNIVRLADGRDVSFYRIEG